MYSVTNNALDKWNVLHPEDGRRELLDAISGGEELAPKFVTLVTGHKIQNEDRDKYITSNDQQGIFVICDDVVITYFPLNAAQVKIIFGVGSFNPVKHESSFFSQLLPGTTVPMNLVRVSAKTHSFLQDRARSLLWAVEQKWTYNALKEHWTAPFDAETTMLLMPSHTGKYTLIPYEPGMPGPYKHPYVVKYYDQLTERYASVPIPITDPKEP